MDRSGHSDLSDGREADHSDVGLPGGARRPGSRLDASGAWRRRPLFWLTLAFCGGILLDDLFQPELPTLGGCFLASVLAVIAVLLSPKGHGNRMPLRFMVALAAALVGGTANHALLGRLPGPTDVSRRTPEAPSLVWLQGTVVDVRRALGGRTYERWAIDVEALGSAPEGLAPASGRIQLSSVPPERTVAEADRLLVLARLEAPIGATLPESFDAAKYLARQGIRRVGSPSMGRIEWLGAAPWWRFDLWLRRFGGKLAARNADGFGAHRAALLNALLLGRRDGLDPSDREAFAKAGTAHLLAISGLHIHALAGVLWWLLSWIGLSRRRAGLAVLAFALAYAALAGAQPSVVRAALMIGIYVGAAVLRKPADPLSTLAASALLILLVCPGDLFLAGFQLSFLAVLALITVYPTLEAAWLQWRGLPEEWIVDEDERRRLWWEQVCRRALLVSFAAWVGTAPAVAWHMGYFTFLSVLTNFIAVPLTIAAILSGLVAMLASQIGWVWMAGVLSSPLSVLLGFNRWMAEGSWNSADVPAPHPVLFLAYAGLLIWAWLGRGRSATLPKLSVVLPAACLSLVLTGLFRSPAESPRVTILDMARGRAALVEAPTGEVALIDTGGEGQGRRIAESLRRQGVKTVSFLVITEDRDAAIGGAVELLERIDFRRVVLPRASVPSASLRELEELLDQRGIPFGAAVPSATLRGPGDVKWAFASDAPPGQPPRAGSESLCVRLTLAGSSMLFANARSSSSLKRLLAQADGSLNADVLRITPGPAGHWPRETATLIARCGARTLVAGQGRLFPGEGTGFDLARFSNAQGLRLLSLRREGSLRFGELGREGLLAFRAGKWRDKGTP